MGHGQRLCGAVLFAWSLLANAGTPEASSLAAEAEAAAQPARSPLEAVNLFQNAVDYQNGVQFDLAAEEYERFLTRFPKDPLVAKARYYLGVCRRELKQYDKAVAAFETVVKSHSDFELIQDAYLNLGVCHSLLGSRDVPGAYAKAATTFAELAAKFPKGKYAAEAIFQQGEAEYQQGNKQEAIAAYVRLIKAHPEASQRPEALYNLGATHQELAQYAEAGKAYDLFLQEFSTHDLAPEARMGKAETLLQAGDFAAAETMFAEVAKLPGFPMVDHALSRHAVCLYQLGKVADAAAIYAKIAGASPQSAFAWDAALEAANCYHRAEKLTEAVQWYQKVIDSPSKRRAEAAHWLGRIYLNDKQYQKVVELNRKVLPDVGDDPFAVHLQMNQADALYELPDSRPSAVAMYRKTATDHPQHEQAPATLVNAAFGALSLEQYDEALKDAAAFLEKYPGHRLVPDAKSVAADCHLMRREYDKAQRLYDELIEAHPDHSRHARWLVWRGWAIYRQKKYEQAIAALQPVVAQLKAPDHRAQALFVIGLSHFYLEQFKPATEALRACFQADPKWGQADEALSFLSRAQLQTGQLAEVIKTVSQLTAAFPDSSHVPTAKFNLGLAQLNGKAYVEAAETYQNLIREHAGHPLIRESHLKLGMSQRLAGKPAEAIKEIDTYLNGLEDLPAKDLPAKSDARFERGLAEVALKEFAKATKTFQQLLAEDPAYAAADQVTYELAWALWSVPDGARRDEALAAFAEVAGKYPDSPLAPEANFRVGQAHFDQGAYDQAARAYAAARQKYPPGEAQNRVTLRLGWALFQLKEYQAAADAFAALAAAEPPDPSRAEALFMRGECLFQLENYQEALPAFLAVEDADLTRPQNKILALLHGGQAAIQLEQWDQAIRLLSRIIEEHPDSASLPEAQFELGQAKRNSGQKQAAMQDYEKAATLSRGEVGAKARFMLGSMAFEEKDFSEAIGQFRRVMYGYGGDAAPPEVKKWQASAGYEAGRCADVQINDAQGSARQDLVKETREYYRYVVENHPQDDLAPLAKKRLEELARM